jgi:hypothetical protein
VLERSILRDNGDARGHHSLHRRVAQPVGGGALEVLEGDLAHQKSGIGDDHAADALPPAEQGGVVDRGPGHDMRRRRHGHLTGRPHGRDGPRHGGGDRRDQIGQRAILDDGRCGGGVPAAAHRGQRGRHVDPAAATARRHEDAALHLHEEEVGVATGEVHHPVGDNADALHVDLLAQRRDEYRRLPDR